MIFCSRCCEDLELDPVHLLCPDLLDADGQAFLAVHGLDAMTLGALRVGAIVKPSGKILIRHRCHQLTPDGLCGIYETRPTLCRTFDCDTRDDCDRTTRKSHQLTVYRPMATDSAGFPIIRTHDDPAGNA